ncbi:MAG: helix-turn-helix transcriptional regulator [Betaproteobacteria bacterium]|nr:helix-turn-helix transcriptional regulator [Betaproteobacteria bacterium]
MPVSRAAVSQHLRVLKEARLVSETAMGTKHIYRAEPEGLAELRRYLESFWGQVLFAYAEEADRRSSKKLKRSKHRKKP